MATQRAVHNVPAWIRWLLPVVLIAQIALRATTPGPVALAAQLGPPPALSTLRMTAIGEPAGLALMLTLYLQAFDTQPGVSLPFSDLDYHNIVRWLDHITALDAPSAYPLLLASQVYSQVPDPKKQRIVLEFVHRKFLDDPVGRWRWLAHASLVARHRLDDMQLALVYANAIARHANDPSVPSWARQMHIFLLEDLGEREAARILLGGLLDSGAVTDAQEMRFLMGRLEAMQSDENSSVLSKD